MGTSKIVFFENSDYDGPAYVCVGSDFNLEPNMPRGIASAIVVRGVWLVYPQRDLQPKRGGRQLTEMGGPNHDGCYPDLATTVFPPQSVALSAESEYERH